MGTKPLMSGGTSENLRQAELAERSRRWWRIIVHRRRSRRTAKWLFEVTLMIYRDYLGIKKVEKSFFMS